MKKLGAFLVLTVAGFSHAQQSLFNVPSGELTKPGHTFFQQQAGYTPSNLQLNSVFCYGLGKHTEVGFDLVNLDLDFSNGFSVGWDDGLVKKAGATPQALGTFLTAHEWNSWWKSSLGTQIGTNLGARSFSRLAATLYTIQTFTLPAEIKVYLGGYVATQAITGMNNLEANLLLGLEIPIVHEKFHLVFDRVGGNNAIGLAVLGGAYFVTPDVVISAGLQLPNDSTMNKTGAIFELTLL